MKQVEYPETFEKSNSNKFLTKLRKCWIHLIAIIFCMSSSILNLYRSIMLYKNSSYMSGFITLVLVIITLILAVVNMYIMYLRIKNS